MRVRVEPAGCDGAAVIRADFDRVARNQKDIVELRGIIGEAQRMPVVGEKLDVAAPVEGVSLEEYLAPGEGNVPGGGANQDRTSNT